MPDRRVPGAILAAAALVVLMAGTSVRAAETPAPRPAATPISCSDRYPADGPAGVNLQLGCTVGRLTGLYTGTGGGEATPLTTYLLPLAGLGVGLLFLWIVLGVLRKRADQRLAVAPTSWWSCPSCSSVNRDGAARCYACGTLWNPDAARLGPPAG